MKRYFLLGFLIGCQASAMQKAMSNVGKFSTRLLRTHPSKRPCVQTLDDAAKFIDLLEKENQELRVQNKYFQQMHNTDRMVMVCMSIVPTLIFSKWVQNKTKKAFAGIIKSD